MESNQLKAVIDNCLQNSGLNGRSPETGAPDQGPDALQLFDPVLVGVAAADDPLFRRFQEPGVVGPHHRLPKDWLPGARSVVSVFLPYTEAVRAANREDKALPARAWLIGRIEGQQLIQGPLCGALMDALRAEGGEVAAPMLDPDFQSWSAADGPEEPGGLAFTSSWSERHAAYACGLGTFGLSRGIITERGMAGRFFSVVTTLVLTPSPRPDTGLYGDCTQCGACVQRCPAGAITLEGGKAHRPCAAYLDHTLELFSPRYGCGKCQTAVPCEARRPQKSGK
ncbi:4Fe-4S binding protein [Eubacterium sp. 1001713B170207_170306_E7]|uniref:4Fe-4S binding protein n=1 Tax=Eubacterium sp. 1001713B170207_170306_E7 TaxID=2787097 RepID=UPI00189A14F2|nr:4Fe-4S binding protein [Eubacterium sp. 1001713B170207_170306_E7]